MHLGRIRAEGAPDALKLEIGPDATLDDVFRRHTGNSLEEGTTARRGIRDVRSVRRTAGRVG
jgi:ABC-2 type transport system ATP-binding protein